jgi:hypothetical protein
MNSVARARALRARRRAENPRLFAEAQHIRGQILRSGHGIGEYCGCCAACRELDRFLEVA